MTTRTASCQHVPDRMNNGNRCKAPLWDFFFFGLIVHWLINLLCKCCFLVVAYITICCVDILPSNVCTNMPFAPLTWIDVLGFLSENAAPSCSKKKKRKKKKVTSLVGKQTCIVWSSKLLYWMIKRLPSVSGSPVSRCHRASKCPWAPLI